MVEHDARTLALKTEEAVLLPAMNRQRMTGGSALASVLRKAKPLTQTGRYRNTKLPDGKGTLSRSRAST